MLARAEIPDRYHAWNRRWGGPFGRPWRHMVPRAWRSAPLAANLSGPFAFQTNNTTRAFEYPWAFEMLGPEPGLRVLEVGGGNSGFQFVLDRSGCSVLNVDPGSKARGKGWPVEPAFLAVLNQRFGTRVELFPGFLEEAGLPDASFDRAVSISVIEHLPEPDILTVLQHVRRVLKPGGLFVLTLDLFLDVVPFAEPVSNHYGKNVSARWLVENSGLELAQGERSELFGFDEFDPERILAQRDRYLEGTGFPVLVQLMVLRKPEA